MASSSSSRKILLWKIIEDEEGDDLLLEQDDIDQNKGIRRPLCSDANRGRQFLHDMINGHPEQCFNLLRMWPDTFNKLCIDLSDMYGLQDTYNMCAKESVAMFLHMCGHNITQRTAMHTFGHSAETVSRKFHQVLNAVVLMAKDMFTQDPASLTKVHPKLQSKKRYYWPYFKGFIGAIDGTHVPVMVSGRDQRRYWNRHGHPTMNILAICDLDMLFTYIYVGIPGSAHDAKVLSLAMDDDPNFPHPPEGKYYFGDSGYALRRGFLCPYRGERYHLNRFVDQPEKNHRELFNRRHSSVRSVIERTFGVWKKKWRIVKDEARYTISTMRKIVVATMTIHNYIRKSNIVDPDFQSVEENANGHAINEDDTPNTVEEDISSRQYMEGVRDEIANAMWASCR